MTDAATYYTLYRYDREQSSALTAIVARWNHNQGFNIRTEMGIVEMTKAHVSAVAKLHRDSIKTGLTAWLGQRFCEHLYWAIGSTPYSFVLVYEDEQHRPLGFICCATNTSKMYKSVILRHFFSLTLSAISKFLRPSVIKRALTAIERPKMFKAGDFSKWELPEAEVVSIAVSPNAQGRHVGTQLLEAAFKRFRCLGHNKIRVWTTEDNEQATAFYRKRGFKFLGVRHHHSGKIFVFVANLTEQNHTTS